MKRDLIERLIDPESGEALELREFEHAGDEIVAGVLTGAGSWYPIIDGVPRMLVGELREDYDGFLEAFDAGVPEPVGGGVEPSRADATAAAKARTTVTFSDKWTRFRRYGFEPQQQEFLNRWYVKKLGLSSLEALDAFYAEKKAILEIGPGSGFNTRYMAARTPGVICAADISVGAVTTHENTRDLDNCLVVQADLMRLPYRDASFDFVIADGVLHHTPDTRAAVEALYRKIAPGGQFFFYVYRRMGFARASCDEHLRAKLSGLDPEACYEACEGITELGRELSRLGATVTLTRGIPALGIPPGEHDVQRLIYYNFLKCFWNEAFDWETNNMVNFDWYHPHHAWQHTDEEVIGWLEDLGVADYSINPANPNGISVLLRKP